MWQVVPGDPEVRRERVRPGEWNLEKEAEKPGHGVWSKIMETSGENDGVVWGYTEGRTSGSRGGSRSRTVKHRGSRRLTPGVERARSEEQGLFGNDVCQKLHLSMIMVEDRKRQGRGSVSPGGRRSGEVRSQVRNLVENESIRRSEYSRSAKARGLPTGRQRPCF
ncbi:hypothetical protein LB505_007056, partial [Fusarium chuoi]